jgi:hypothetical protein
MNYKIQLHAFLIATLFTAAALLPTGCASSSSGPDAALPVEYYD